MRITNGIMINNNLFNINKNKIQMDNIMTQISTTKKIQRPSDDPITAIRALRLRSTYSEIQQYKDRNVDDAESWMETTKSAMDKANETLENIIYYCNQGVNTYQTSEEYQAIIKTMQQFKDAVYEGANIDYGDRTVFTGYKTDTTLTFTKNDPTIKYDITEKRNFSEIEDIERLVGVDSADVDNPAGAGVYVGTDITNETLHVMRLAYSEIDAGAVTINPAAGTINRVSLAAAGNDAYANIGADEIRCIQETGELIFGDNVYNKLVNADFSVSYSKTGFKTGELRPEHYFDCVKHETVGTEQKDTTYTAKDQQIDYIVSFNQSITVNVQGQDVFKHAIGRDVDEIIARVENLTKVIDKLSTIDAKLERAETDSDKEKLTAMKEAAELEKSYAEENLKNSFADGIKKFKGHQQTVSVELSDLAARMNRLSMIKDRLEQQSLTVEELKSKNEDTNLSDAAVEYNAMSDVYDAALSTAVKVVQKSLLNFL